MTAVALVADSLTALRERFPWPNERPLLPRIEWTLDYGGRHLVTDFLRASSPQLIVEIGCFLGGSLRGWLEAAPAAWVIAIDAWQWRDPVPALLELASAEIVEQLRAPEGFYRTFLANLWEYRERVVPMRRRSPEALYELAELGVQPDFIYLDADKKGRELEIAHELFPRAVLAGDDWFWGREQGYPIRQPVRDFCRRHGFYVRTRKMTWLVGRRPSGMLQTMCDRVTDAIWAVGQLMRPTVRRPRMEHGSNPARRSRNHIPSPPDTPGGEG